MNPNPNLLGLNTAAAISLLIGVGLPLAVGLMTKRSMNAGLKAAILAALSAVSSVLTQWAQALNDHQQFAWQAAVAGALVTWVTGELTYFKVWKPSGIAATVQAKGNADPAPTLDPSLFAYDTVPSLATSVPASDPVPSTAPIGPYEPRHDANGNEVPFP